MRSCLAGEIVADLADAELRLYAAGPWQAVFSRNGRPGDEWYAAAPVLERVREILTGLTLQDLMSVAAAHHGLCGLDAEHDEQHDERYARLRNRLTSWSVVSAAGSPPVLQLLRDVTLAGQLAIKAVVRSDEESELLRALTDWLDCLTSLLVHRPRLRRDDVRTFARSGSAVLPGFEKRLNAPV
jgi:hypothetical protein